VSIRFDGKSAIVTGGGMGIGRATVLLLAELGASVAILDRDSAGGEVAGEIRARKQSATFFQCDISGSDQTREAVAAVRRDFGGVDILVSNAGIQRYGSVTDTSDELWAEVLDTNLKGCFNVSKAVIPAMQSRGAGAIVVVNSVQAFTAIGNSAAYVTSKHALLGLVRAMALDHAAQNIRVNCVCPGAIDTPMLRAAANLNVDPEKVLAACRGMHPLSRLGQPEEIAQAIAFLASDWASFITGVALPVDGGMLIPTGGMAFQESGTGSNKNSA
jgi:NAD(P)-dependent dehydrogenase (short-subunit alcohol dehydrogenase family)